MFKIKVITQGKEKNNWLTQALQEYEKRVSKDFIFSWIFAKDDRQMEELLDKEKTFLCLDDKGKLLDSTAFSHFFFSSLEKNGSRLTFCIGGATGIPERVRKKAQSLISLSPLTFTHQITRLIFVEQIYRAYQIRNNTPYVK